MEYVAAALTWVHGIICPGPTTAPFMPGGPLEAFNEDLCQIAAALVFFFIVDFTIVKRVIVPKARYFALHTVCNALVCIATYRGVLTALTGDPLTFLTGPGEVLGNNIVVALHLYHCLAFKLSADDIFHHLTFVSTLGVMAISVKRTSGINIPYAIFFLSGLPGGIDYAMLTLVAHGHVTKAFQKRAYAAINLWLRGPALCLYGFFWWTAYRVGHPIHPIVIAAAVALHVYNGQYYAQQAIESNALFAYRAKLAAKGVAVPEVRLADLHKKE